MKYFFCGIMNWTSILILIVFSFAVSCNENPSNSNRPVISSISSHNPVVGDTLMIGGEHFGWNTSSARLVLNNLQLGSLSCIKWNNNFIKFVVPNNAESGKLFLIVGTDTSNYVNITISKFPSFEMAEIVPDSFFMGSDVGFRPESPIHLIKLTKKYLIGKTEVSQRLWKALMDSNPSKVKMNQLPVYGISWMDAVTFCNKLSKIDGYTPYYKIAGDTVTPDTSSTGYRLPTEAEWEYACRFRSSGDFYDNLPISDIGWYDLNSGFVPHISSGKQPNKFGISDMIGNVWEWCWDYYDENYYKFSTKIDPIGPKSGKIRILRGGSFASGQTYCRSTNRIFPESTFENCGLRIVRSVK